MRIFWHFLLCVCVITGVAQPDSFCFTNFQEMNGMASSSILVGDLNKDGYPDFSSDGGISNYLSSGNGTYTMVTYPGTWIWQALLDLNADGFSDVISRNWDTIFVYHSCCNGSLTPVGSFSVTEATGFATRDINNDGRDDLVLTQYTQKKIQVFLASASGSLIPSFSYSLSGRPTCVVIDDFNNDSKRDLFITCDSATYIFKGTGVGSFTPISSPFLNSSYVKAHDINKDNKADLIYIDPSLNRIGVKLGLGNYSFSTSSTFSVSTAGLSSFAIGDVNNDTKVDLVVIAPAFTTSAHGFVLKGIGTGSFQQVSTLSNGGFYRMWDVCLSDMNADGRLDIIASQVGPMPLPFLYFTNCNTVGLDESAIVQTILFPNPNNGAFEIEVLNAPGTCAMIQIMNEVGQVVFQENKLSLANNKIYVKSEIPRGIYTVQLSIGNKIGRTKIAVSE
jgi:hypothetical protein